VRRYSGVLSLAVRATTPARSFSLEEWRRFAGLAVWLAAALTTQFVGTDLTTAGQGSLLTTLTPVFMVGLGVTALGERLTVGEVLGTGIAALGTAVVLAGQCDLASVANGSVLGAAPLLVSAAAFAAFSAFWKPPIDRYSALETATHATVLSVPMFVVLVPTEAALRPTAVASIPVRAPVVGAVLYLGVVSTAAAWYFWYEGMEYAGASTVAVYFFAQPVVGTALGAVLLGEHAGGSGVGGGALLALGVFPVDGSGHSADGAD